MYSGLTIEDMPGDEEAVLFLSGTMTYDDEKQFDTALQASLSEKVKRLILDLSGLEFISSAGLGLLLVALEYTGKKKVEFILANPSTVVARNLELMQFAQLMTIAEMDFKSGH